MMKKFVCLFALAALTALAFAGSAAALSDAEYKKLMKDSSEFAEADKELTKAWNEAKKALGKNDFENLKKEQKAWIDSGRDKRAKKLIADGMSSDVAYAVATRDRAKELRGSIIQYGASTRHDAYMKAARAFVKEHKFPNGDAIGEEDLGLERFFLHGSRFFHGCRFLCGDGFPCRDSGLLFLRGCGGLFLRCGCCAERSVLPGRHCTFRLAGCAFFLMSGDRNGLRGFPGGGNRSPFCFRIIFHRKKGSEDLFSCIELLY